MNARTTTADNAEIIAEAVRSARSKKDQHRGTFPRFLLLVDGETIRIATVKSLARELSSIKEGETCWVFRNGGYGATITFTKPNWA